MDGNFTVYDNLSWDNDTEVVNRTENGSNSPLKQAHDALAVIILLLIMLAMGCHITWAEVWIHIKRPVGLIIGLACQFLFMPLAGFCLIKATQLDGLVATGVLVTACSAGGVTSNMFTYFADGDVSLSITMTVFSTVFALFMMPANLWMYGRSLETKEVVIPYLKIIISLVAVTAPVALGLLINWKAKKIAPYITKAGSWAGIAFIIVVQTMDIFIFPDLFDGIPWTMYVANILLPVIGVTVGYCICWLFKRPPPVRKTVAIESGVQNVGIALTIVALSFKFEDQKKVLIFPWLYAFTMTAVCVIIAVGYQIYKKYYPQPDTVEITKKPASQNATKDWKFSKRRHASLHRGRLEFCCIERFDEFVHRTSELGIAEQEFRGLNDRRGVIIRHHGLVDHFYHSPLQFRFVFEQELDDGCEVFGSNCRTSSETVKQDASGTGTFANQDQVLGIATEKFRIGRYPLQSQFLVVYTSVTGSFAVIQIDETQ